MLTQKTLIERFAEKFSVSSLDKCWEWNAARTGKGYCSFRVGRKTVDAHRLMYRFEFGTIPPGMEVCHRCDNPRCVNPNHLFLGTHRDNMRDMSAKGRSLKGRKNPNYSRVGMPQGSDCEKMRELRALGHSYRSIARLTGYGTMTVHDHLKGGL